MIKKKKTRGKWGKVLGIFFFYKNIESNVRDE